MHVSYNASVVCIYGFLLWFVVMIVYGYGSLIDRHVYIYMHATNLLDTYQQGNTLWRTLVANVLKLLVNCSNYNFLSINISHVELTIREN